MSERIRFPREMRAEEKSRNADGSGLFAMSLQWTRTSMEVFGWAPLSFLTQMSQLISRVTYGMSVENAVEEVFSVEYLLDDDLEPFSLTWMKSEYGGELLVRIPHSALIFNLQRGGTSLTIRENGTAWFRPNRVGVDYPVRRIQTRRDARQLMRALDYQV